MTSRSIILRFVALAIFALASANVQAQIPPGDSIRAERTLAGVVVNDRSEAVAGATVTAQWQTGRRSFVTDAQGGFLFSVPSAAVRLTVTGKFIGANETTLADDGPVLNLELRIHYEIPATAETLVITASVVDPAIDRRNDTVYKNTLFLRDDQLFETLDSGINAGQHEGGGKSIEVRRFGFNLDHGGLNGGLKVLVDDIPQNQATQGHGRATWAP